MKTKLVLIACAGAALLFGLYILSRQDAPSMAVEDFSSSPSTARQTSGLSNPESVIAATPKQSEIAGVEAEASRSTTRPPKSLSQLPAENALLQRGKIDSARISQALKPENFGAIFSAFETDASTDSLATQMTSAYRTAIGTTLAGDGMGVLERFSCGLSLCIGSVRSRDGAELPEDWWEKMNNGNDLSIFALSQITTALDRRTTETRFIFSTSQENNGFYIAPSR